MTLQNRRDCKWQNFGTYSFWRIVGIHSNALNFPIPAIYCTPVTVFEHRTSTSYRVVIKMKFTRTNIKVETFEVLLKSSVKFGVFSVFR